MNKRIMIDAGHGGADNGAIGFGVREKDWTLEISLYQARRFREIGIDTISLTREADLDLTPEERAQRVRLSGATVCISNHINAFNGEASGVETIHSIYADPGLATSIFDAIVATGMPGRRVFTRRSAVNNLKDYYFMHRNTGRVETVIVEYGFIDNAADFAFIEQNKFAMAEAVVKVVCEYLGYEYKPPKGEKKMDSNKWRNKGLWVSVISLITLIMSNYDLFELISMDETTFQKIIEMILGVLVAAGIISNPSSGNSFSDEKK